MSRPEQTPFQPQPPEITQENNALINQLEDNLPRDSRGRIAWKQIPQNDIITYLEAKANTLMNKEENLYQSSLRTKHLDWFNRAVTKYYPGGLLELQKKCCVQPAQKPNGYWQRPEAVEEIRSEAQACFDKAGKAGHAVFQELGRNDLKVAIQRFYPGGFPQLFKDLKKRPQHRHRNYWNINTIEKESNLFIEEHGNITKQLLGNSGRDDLGNAINRKYPGGLIKFKMDRGLIVPLPQVDKKTGEFIDDNRMLWIASYAIAKKIGTNHKMVIKYLQFCAVPSIQGIGGNNREVTLYNESEALKVLEQVKNQSAQKIDSTEANEYMRKLLSE